MKDDLFERLRAVDPASERRIAEASRALGNTPTRIVESEPSNVRRFPTAARRKATLVAVAAVVVVAIALPLTLLRSLGDGDRPGGGPGGATGAVSRPWLSVGTLDALRVQGGVAYVPDVDTFVFVPESGQPYTVYTVLTDDRRGQEERALYCEGTDQFLASRGDVFDGHGAHLAGNGAHDLAYRPVRVTDGGQVQIDTGEYDVPLGPKAAGPTVTRISEACPTAGGLPLEGRPGFAVPAGTQLPPIAVSMPQSGMRVMSPVTIAGSADVFEATVSIRVLDANGDLIAESFAMATCGTGCRGDFTTQVDVPIDAEQPGTIQVFEASAQDGSMINTVEIPVTLDPGPASADNAVEGIWFDHDGSPLPDGSTGSAGTTLAVFPGPEHCQWGSATFMDLAWPLGSLVTSADDALRQYVRDPEGMFDGGALHVGFLHDTTLPPDAADTGYQRKPWALWISPSQADDAVFVVNTETGVVERWGRSTRRIGCD